jgi:prephenate dehydrogenase
MAMAIRQAWPSIRIAACDRPERLEAGRRRGLLDAGVPQPADLAGSELIVLAVPLSAMPEMIAAIGRSSPAGIVTDVGSTKRTIITAARAAGLGRFVGGHPMAGTEHAGLDHARADLFQGRPWLLVESAPADRDDGRRLEALVRAFGARPRWVGADEHDRTMAYVSHLPQLLATTLMNVAAQQVGDPGLTAAGPAFLQMTRLASSPADLWQGILADNADFTAEALAALVEALPGRPQIESAEWVRRAFTQARHARHAWQSFDPRTE